MMTPEEFYNQHYQYPQSEVEQVSRKSAIHFADAYRKHILASDGGLADVRCRFDSGDQVFERLEMTHRNLCIKAARYLRSKGIHPFHKGQYSVCELERVGECPDAFAWGGSSTQLIEVKVSRADYLSDAKKYWRKHPEYGLGKFRSYICPEGLIKPEELPQAWGLLYITEKGKIAEIVKAEHQQSNHTEEINLITSILRRENIKPQMFSYKQYRAEANVF